MLNFMKRVRGEHRLEKGGGKGGGGGGGGGTQTMINEPWADQKPYLQQIMKESQNLYEKDNQDYFPNATYVPFSPQSEVAMTLAQNRALQGSPLTQQGKNLTSQTLNGDYLNSNPHLDKMYDNAAGAVTRNYREALAPTIDSQFSKAGRYGSEMHSNAHDQAQDNLGRSLTQLADNTYGKNYAIERQNQQSLLPFSQQLAQNDYNEIGQLANIGAAVEGKGTEMLNDQIDRFNYYQNLPQKKLKAFSNIVNGVGSYNSSTQTMPEQNNTASNIIGGGMAGYGLAQQFGEGTMFANPWMGAGIGAAAGLLF